MGYALVAALWTFCVGGSGRDIWISDVVAAAQAGERLGAEFAAELRVRGAERPHGECPAPQADKTDVVNAQFTALEFHRKLGDVLHAAEPPGVNR